MLTSQTWTASWLDEWMIICYYVEHFSTQRWATWELMHVRPVCPDFAKFRHFEENVKILGYYKVTF